MLTKVLEAVGTKTELVDTIAARENSWLGNVQRHDSLLRMVLLRTMFLHWLLKSDVGNVGYDQLKLSAQDQLVPVKTETCQVGRILLLLLLLLLTDVANSKIQTIYVISALTLLVG